MFLITEYFTGGKTVMTYKEIGFIDELKLRVKELERRLSAVEQPVWTLAKGSVSEWIRCTEGKYCTCLTVTKSLNCWNSGLKTVPVAQTIPMDILNMYVLCTGSH